MQKRHTPPKKPGKVRRSPTIADVAARAGVSTSTVSYVMNDRNRVGPETKERVFKAIAELGYRPNSSAKGLASRRVGSIGLVIPHSPDSVFADPFFPELLRGISRVANRRGLYLFLSLVQEHQLYEAGMEVLKSRRADGLIVIDPREAHTQIPDLVDEGFPLVVIGRQEYEAPFVDVDNIGGARAAAWHLMHGRVDSHGKGQSKVAIISGPCRQRAAEDRLIGYRQGLEQLGYPWEKVHIEHGDFSEASGHRCMIRLLTSHLPRFVLVANDLMAIGAYQAISEAGLSIPVDVALVGFDDIAFTKYLTPPLTTVRQPIAALGEEAAAMLCAAIKGDAVQSKILPVELIPRASCGR